MTAGLLASQHWTCQPGDGHLRPDPAPLMATVKPITRRTQCQSTADPAVSAPTARPPITLAGLPACGSASPPATRRCRTAYGDRRAEQKGGYKAWHRNGDSEPVPLRRSGIPPLAADRRSTCRSASQQELPNGAKLSVA